MKKEEKNSRDINQGQSLGGRQLKPPTISACMMVKNEEDFLPQCLESISGFVDEIVIVDTGSTDRTVEIAERFGTVVYHHPWEDDFSKHRNQSISYAKGDWIFVIDADEKLDPSSINLLRNFMSVHDPDIITIFVRSYLEGGTNYNETTSPRIFKNHIGMEYLGIVHNQLNCKGRSVAFVKAVIWHYGYDLDESKQKQKTDRTVKLLLRQSEAMPDDAATAHHLAASYFFQEDYQRSYAAGLKVRKLLENDSAKEKQSAFSWTYFILVASLFEMERFDEAEEICEEGLALFSNSIDLHFTMAFISLRRQKYDKALQHLKKYFLLRNEFAAAPEKFGFVVFEKANKVWEAYKMEGTALMFLNRRSEAVTAFQKSIDLAPEDVKEAFCSGIGKMLYKKGFEGDAISFWKQLPPDAEYEEDLKMVGLLLMKNKQWDEAIKVFDSIKGCDSKDVFYHMGVASMELGRYKEASACFGEVYRIDPNWEKNFVNWGVTLEKCGLLTAAIEKYEQAIEISAGQSLAYQNLGCLYFRERKFTQALPYIESANTISPENIYLQLVLARCYFETGEIELMVGICEKILRLLNLPADFLIESMSQIADLFVGISKELLQQKDLDSYDIAFELAKHLGPQSTDGLKKLSLLAFSRNEYTQGISILETALSIDPKDPEIASMIQRYIKELEV